jgi:hypothetical protein
MPTEIIDQTAFINLILWIGGVITVAMSSAVAVLWYAKEKRDNYIREQDKANQSLLMEIANNYKSMGVDVSKIEQLVSKEIKPSVDEVRIHVISLVNGS